MTEKWDKWQLSSIKLCFVFNVLNNKTIVQLSLAEYYLILATRPTATWAKYQAIFRAISQG